MTVNESELREQFRETFKDANYPVESVTSLAVALPKGPMTKFNVGDESISAMELASEIQSHADFPYADVESLIEDLISALRAEGRLE